MEHMGAVETHTHEPEPESSTDIMDPVGPDGDSRDIHADDPHEDGKGRE